MNVTAAIAFLALATIKGGLVALPGPAALDRLGRLRSPAWALVGPGALIVGTLGVLALPPLATGLVVAAAVATPILAAIAVVGVVHRGRRSLLLVPLVLVVVVAAGSGWPRDLAASLLTALGCLTLGAALVRLTPARWLRLGVVAMVLLDVLLLAAGLGQPAAALVKDAMGTTGPTFDHAQLGTVSTDYPDLVLAAVVGSSIAGKAIQPRAAALVAVLAVAYDALLVFTDMLPATVPLLTAVLLIELAGAWPAVAKRRRGRVRPSYAT